MRKVDIEALCIGMQIRKPVLMWGAPGIGKSSLVESIFIGLQVLLETVIASIREPSDFSGLPVVQDDGSVRFATPQWAKKVLEAAAEAGPDALLAAGIFFDELSTAPPAVQAALLRVILGGVVGDTVLPKNVTMIAAANPPETSAGGWEMTAPLANRFIHIQVSSSPDTFCEGMVSGWPQPEVSPLPENWKARLIMTRASVASFIKARPAQLYQFPEDASKTGGPWASPRTWDYLATAEAACHEHATEEAEIILMSGCVGEGPAFEYTSWRRELDLPNPEMLLKNPGKLILPERGDRAYAILTSVVAAVLSNNTGDRWLACWDVLEAATKSGIPDVAAGCAYTLATNQPPGVTVPKSVAAFGPLIIKAGYLPE